MKIKLLGVLVISLFSLYFFSGTAAAADKLVFDSTDHYLGACALTDKSEWELKEDIDVTTFQVWYNWAQGETELPVEIFKDGELFAEFIATRGGCDPYQTQWCNADFKINKLFPKGKYTTQIPNKRQCLKPGGTGAIRLYVEDNTAVEPIKDMPSIETEPTPNESSTAPVPTLYENTPEPETIAYTDPAKPAAQVVNNCTCTTKQVIAYAAGTSFITSFVLGLILKKR